MKKIFGLLITMFAMYLLIQLGYRYFSKGYEENYIVDGYNVFEKYDWIVSNPPYIVSNKIDHLQREVQKEPR